MKTLEKFMQTVILLSAQYAGLSKSAEHVVAVYEHAHISGSAATREEALEIMRSNAEIYRDQISVASSKVAARTLYEYVYAS